VEVVARKLVRRDIVPEVAGLCDLGQQVSDHVDELLLRPSDLLTSMQECREFGAVVLHFAFKLSGVHCLGCATAVEEALRAQPSVTDVRLDWRADVVRVGYDPTKIGREDIERVIADTGCECEPVEARGELPKKASRFG
jgi:copper chaperone CopZ